VSTDRQSEAPASGLSGNNKRLQPSKTFDAGRMSGGIEAV
jgi:hypothetical protein